VSSPFWKYCATNSGEIYGDSVVEMLREASVNNAWREAQVEIEFDDDIEF